MAFNQKQAGYLKDYINLEIKDAERQIKQMDLKLKEKKLNSNRVRKKQENTRNSIEQKQFESEQEQKNKYNEEEFNYGEKKKSIHITKTYNIFWTQIKDDDNWKPESREGGSLIQQDRFLVLYGGIGKQFLDQVAYFDLMRFQWEKKPSPKIGEIQPDKGRRGMTTNIHKDKIIYFGGEKRYNDQLKIRQCYLDFKQYDFGKNQWSVLKLDQFSSMVIARRDHCTVNISNKYLFYYGGIDSNGKYITEPQILNLETLKNYNVELQVAQKSKAKIMPIAYFTMKAIFKSEFTLEKIYTPIQFKKYSIKQPVKEEGIYIFGGKNENGKANNYLHIIKPGQAPYIFDRLVPEGQPPEARYGHSMDYCHSLNSFVIYGGCNEDSSNVYFNDVHILDLQYLIWCKVEVQGPQFSGRAMHCSTLVDDKIFIFGGLNQQGLQNPDIFILELDQRKVNNLGQSYKKQYQYMREYRTVQEVCSIDYYNVSVKNIKLRKKNQQNYDGCDQVPEKVLKDLATFQQEMQGSKKQVLSFQPQQQQNKNNIGMQLSSALVGYNKQENSLILNLNDNQSKNPITNKKTKQLMGLFLQKLSQEQGQRSMSIATFERQKQKKITDIFNKKKD